MKLVATLIASMFALTAVAAEPGKKEEKKVEAKPVVVAPAPVAGTPAKSDAKPTEKKAEPTKK